MQKDGEIKKGNFETVLPYDDFNYIYNDSLDRVYQYFINAEFLFKKAYADLITIYKFDTGKKLDEKGTKFFLIWKNYYKIYFKVIKEDTDSKNYRCFSHKTIKISQFETASFQIKYQFWWNSCEKKTVVIINISYNNEFVKELFGEEFTKDEIMGVFREIDENIQIGYDYLKDLETSILNFNINDIWNEIITLERFFTLENSNYSIGENFEEENKIFKGKIYKIINKLNFEEIASIKISSLENSEENKGLTLECTTLSNGEEENKKFITNSPDKDDFASEDELFIIPSQMIIKQELTIKLKYITEKETYILVQHIPGEHTDYNSVKDLKIMKKDIIKNLSEYLESKI